MPSPPHWEWDWIFPQRVHESSKERRLRTMQLSWLHKRNATERECCVFATRIGIRIKKSMPGIQRNPTRILPKDFDLRGPPLRHLQCQVGGPRKSDYSRRNVKCGVTVGFLQSKPCRHFIQYIVGGEATRQAYLKSATGRNLAFKGDDHSVRRCLKESVHYSS